MAIFVTQLNYIMVKASPELLKAFDFLANRSASKQEHLGKGETSFMSDESWLKSIKELSSLGLIEVNRGVYTKSEEFYKAEMQGFIVWFAKWHRDRKRARQKDDWDYRASWVKANTWWVAIIISIASIIMAFIALIR